MRAYADEMALTGSDGVSGAGAFAHDDGDTAATASAYTPPGVNWHLAGTYTALEHGLAAVKYCFFKS